MPNHQIDYRLKARIQPVTRQQDEDEENGRFEFETVSSNNNLDFFFTHMLRSTLENFVRDGKDGRQFLDSHNNRNLGYGRTFDGRLEVITNRQPTYDLQMSEGELAFTPEQVFLQAILMTFTVRGIEFGGKLTYKSTDDFIRAVEAEIARDISVGLYGGRWTCDICGGNYRSWRDCQHIAGFVYEAGEQGQRKLIATVGIDGARLAEHSVVYEGATPEAMIRKVQSMSQAGEIEPERKKIIEARYKILLPDGRTIHSTAEITGNGTGTPLPNTESSGELSLRTALDAGNNPNGGVFMDLERIRQLLGMEEGATAEDVATRLTDLTAERAETEDEEVTRQLAEDGRAYRSDLISTALEEGVRAIGNDFQADSYRGMLEQSSIEVIKRMSADWKTTGDNRAKAPRITENEEEQKKGRNIPAAAFRS